MTTYQGNGYALEIDGSGIRIVMDGVSCACLRPDAVVEKYASDVPDVTESSEFREIREGEYVWELRGRAWDKRITLLADPEGFDFRVKLSGRGSMTLISPAGVTGTQSSIRALKVPSVRGSKTR